MPTVLIKDKKKRAPKSSGEQDYEKRFNKKIKEVIPAFTQKLIQVFWQFQKEVQKVERCSTF